MRYFKQHISAPSLRFKVNIANLIRAVCSKIEGNGKCSNEIKRRTAMAAGQLKKMEKKSGKDKINKQS